MSLHRIANVDVKGGELWVVILDEDCNPRIVKRPFKHFMLSPKNPDVFWLRLKGEGYFRFIKFYEEKGLEFWDDYQSLADKFVIHQDIEAARVLTGIQLFEGLTPQDLCVLSFDIETNGLAMDKNSLLLILSCTVRKKGQILRKLFAYDEYGSQAQMLRAWVQWVNEINPNVLCAYHGFGFDWPFISHVAQMHGVELTLGRDGSELRTSRRDSHYRKEGGQEYAYRDLKIFGREYVDVMFLTMKADQAARKFESYALKSVVKQLGLEREDRQHFDASQIQTLYQDPVEWAKIKQYAIHDADDGLALFEKFIPPYFAITQLIPKSLQQIIHGATGSQINSCLVASYLQLSHSIPKASPTIQYQGGMTIAKPGLWKDAFRVDVASLYPSICLAWNIHDPLKDPFNHFIRFLGAWTKERLEFKSLYQKTGDENAKAMSDALKILANSTYGMMAAPGLNYNSPKRASEITRHGREILQKAIQYAESQGFEVFFGDTDSLAFGERSAA
jgi:DNA polymerase elongation subunit (family B)